MREELGRERERDEGKNKIREIYRRGHSGQLWHRDCTGRRKERGVGRKRDGGLGEKQKIGIG